MFLGSTNHVKFLLLECLIVKLFRRDNSFFTTLSRGFGTLVCRYIFDGCFIGQHLCIGNGRFPSTSETSVGSSASTTSSSSANASSVTGSIPNSASLKAARFAIASDFGSSPQKHRWHLHLLAPLDSMAQRTPGLSDAGSAGCIGFAASGSHSV